MRYLARLHRETDGAYSVAVVELPGCFSIGDTLPDAISNVEKAILGHIEVLVADGKPIPRPCEDAPRNLGRGEMIAAVDVPLDKLSVPNKAVRLNVSIPGYAVGVIDQAASRAGTSRSGFLTRAALAVIEQDIKIA